MEHFWQRQWIIKHFQPLVGFGTVLEKCHVCDSRDRPPSPFVSSAVETRAPPNGWRGRTRARIGAMTSPLPLALGSAPIVSASACGAPPPVDPAVNQVETCPPTSPSTPASRHPRSPNRAVNGSRTGSRPGAALPDRPQDQLPAPPRPPAPPPRARHPAFPDPAPGRGRPVLPDPGDEVPR